MAALTICLYDLNGAPVDGGDLLSYELNREDGVPCDSLLLAFRGAEPLPEIGMVKAYEDNRLVFSGCGDLQRDSFGGDGHQTLLYARSTAVLLTDNEAQPRTVTAPTAHTLFLLNTVGTAFTCDLPTLGCEADYTVSKGTSCYHAIDDFVFALTNRHIAVSPENKVYLPDGQGEISVSEGDLLSECRITDRGAPLSSIDYKAEGDAGYEHHLLSRYMERRGICRSRAVSLSALPAWQQNAALTGQLRTAAARYQRLEIKLDGCWLPSLYDRVRYQSALAVQPETYHITGITVAGNAGGEQTTLQLVKQIDGEEITYVA